MSDEPEAPWRDEHDEPIELGDWVFVDTGFGLSIERVEKLDRTEAGTPFVVLDSGDDYVASVVEKLVPHPAEDPQWFRAPNRWVAPVGDGSVIVELYDDELASLPGYVGTDRPLRVEVWETSRVDAGPDGSLRVPKFWWRARHESNGEIVAQGEGYSDPRPRDHMVRFLFPDIEPVEVAE